MTEQPAKVRLTPVQRKAMIMTAALALSKEWGLLNWTRNDVAARCALTTPTSYETVKHYFPSQGDFRLAIAQHPERTEQILVDARAVGMIA